MIPSQWPRARYGPYPDKTLACLRGRQAVTEHGEIVDLPDWSSVVRAGAQGLLLLSERQSDWWLAEAVADPETTVYYHRLRGVTAVRTGRGWIVPMRSWTNETGPRALAVIRGAIDLLGCGAGATAASLGQSWLRDRFPRDVTPLYRPQWPVWEAVRASITGGRADLHSPVRDAPVIYEADINGAYLAACRQVPSGVVRRYLFEPPEGLPAYGEWEVGVPPMALGPLRQRTRGGPVYPNFGMWRDWYWSHEITALRRLGGTAVPLGGWYWAAYHEGLAGAVAALYALQSSIVDKSVQRVVKLAGVAGIGRWGRPRTLTTLEPAGPSDELAVDPIRGVDVGRAVRTRTPDPESEGLLVHVASYVHSVVRMETTLMALGAAQAGTLVATNFDAVYTTRPPDLEPSRDLGRWKVRVLHDVTITRSRWIMSEEKTRTPGVPVERRQDYA